MSNSNTAAAGGDKISMQQRMKNFLCTDFPVLGLILVMIFFYIQTDGKIFSSFNLKSISQQMYLFILGGLGCCFLFAQGAIDLSMAAAVGFAGIIGVRTMLATNVFVVGAVNGFLYAKVGIPVFIQGMAMNFLLNGLLLPLCAGSATITAPKALTDFKSIAAEIVIEVILFLVVAVIYNFTRFGKDCRAIGAGTS